MAWLVVGLVVVIVLVLFLNGLSSALRQEQEDVIIPYGAALDDHMEPDETEPCELCGRESEHYCEICKEWVCDGCWSAHVMCEYIANCPVYEWNGLEGRRVF